MTPPAYKAGQITNGVDFGRRTAAGITYRAFEHCARIATVSAVLHAHMHEEGADQRATRSSAGVTACRTAFAARLTAVHAITRPAIVTILVSGAA